MVFGSILKTSTFTRHLYSLKWPNYMIQCITLVRIYQNICSRLPHVSLWSTKEAVPQTPYTTWTSTLNTARQVQLTINLKKKKLTKLSIQVLKYPGMGVQLHFILVPQFFVDEYLWVEQLVIIIISDIMGWHDSIEIWGITNKTWKKRQISIINKTYIFMHWLSVIPFFQVRISNKNKGSEDC